MGQKVNPNVIRLGITKFWTSNWFTHNKNTYTKTLEEDYKIRKYFFKEFSNAGISRIFIERTNKQIRLIVYSYRPPMIIKDVKSSKALYLKIENISHLTANIIIKKIEYPEIDVHLIAENLASQFNKIVSRSILKRTVKIAMKKGVRGIKIEVNGRLSGQDIARTEWYREGRVPLQTFTANIDYCCTKSFTKYGVIGIKVWIYKFEDVDQMPYEIKSKEEENTLHKNKKHDKVMEKNATT